MEDFKTIGDSEISGQNISKDITELKSTFNLLDLIDMYKITPSPGEWEWHGEGVNRGKKETYVII